MKDVIQANIEQYVTQTTLGRRRFLVGSLGAGALALGIACSNEQIQAQKAEGPQLTDVQLGITPTLEAYRRLDELNGVNQVQALLMLPATLAQNGNPTAVLGYYSILKRNMNDDAAAIIANSTIESFLDVEKIKNNISIAKKSTGLNDARAASATADIMVNRYNPEQYLLAIQAAKKFVGSDDAQTFTSISFAIDLNTDNTYDLYRKMGQFSGNTATKLYYLLLTGLGRVNTGNLTADLEASMERIKQAKKAVEDKPGSIGGYTKPTLIHAASLNGNLDPVYEEFNFIEGKVSGNDELMSKEDIAADIVLIHEVRKNATKAAIKLIPHPNVA